VDQSSDELRPLSPLTATEMAELCREAFTVAYQIKHADDMELRVRTTALSGNNEMSRNIRPVKDTISNIPVECQNERVGGVKPLLSVAEASGTSSSSDVEVKALEELLAGVAVAYRGEPSDSSELKINDAKTTAASSAVEPYEAYHTGVLSSDHVSRVFTADVAVAYRDEPSDSSELKSNDPETAAASSVVELCQEYHTGMSSSDDLSRELTADVAVNEPADSSELPSKDVAAASDAELLDNKPTSNNCLEGLLSSLGFALPVIETSCLKEDENSVVKFTAAGANTKCRTGIPAPSGLRRAASAKSTGIRSAGIPMKVLTVRSLMSFIWPIIGIGQLSASLPIIGIGRLLPRYRPIVIYSFSKYKFFIRLYPCFNVVW